jgi:dTDP-glucose 4,6-dehydratase
MEKKVAVIAGAAGFIGSHLSETLIQRGVQVIGIDNFVTGSLENIEYLSQYSDFEFVEHDIGKPLNNLLELARTKTARFIFSSSSEVYGDPEQNPQVESYNGNVNITGIRSIYDESKRYGETMSLTFKREYNLPVRIVRIFNTYGERMRKDDGRAIPTFINQALINADLTVFGNGSQTRSPQYVSDLVNGVLLLADSDVEVPVNIGNPEEISMHDLALKIRELAASQSEIIYQELPEHDPKVRKPDITRAKTLLGWEPKVGMTEGLSRTISWFKSKA